MKMLRLIKALENKMPELDLVGTRLRIVFLGFEKKKKLSSFTFHRANHLSIAALFSSPYGYLGQIVLFYIFVNLSCYYYCIMLGTNKSCCCCCCRKMPIVLGTFTCSSRNISGLSYYLVLFK